MLIHDFAVRLSNGSNKVDINRFKSHTGIWITILYKKKEGGRLC